MKIAHFIKIGENGGIPHFLVKLLQMGEMSKMDQNTPKIQWPTVHSATGGAKGAKSATISKMSTKMRK